MSAATADPIVLRAATRDDVAAVAAIELASFSDPWSVRAFADLLDAPAVRFLVATADGAVVGYLVAVFAADEAEIANVAVDPACRGRGIGARLLDEALAEGGRRGTAQMYLEVRASNVAAQRLYASRGFEGVGRRKRYYERPPEDALVLRRTFGAGVDGGA